jgi:transposase
MLSNCSSTRRRAAKITPVGIYDRRYEAVRVEAKIPLEIVKRSDTAKGFKVLPKRWIVERTFGWLGRCRRLAKDFENLARSHAAFVILAMIRIMLRRIVRLSQTL